MSTSGAHSVVCVGVLELTLLRQLPLRSAASEVPLILSTCVTTDFLGLGERRALAAQWKMNLELAIDLASLSLYDTVIYCGEL